MQTAKLLRLYRPISSGPGPSLARRFAFAATPAERPASKSTGAAAPEAPAVRFAREGRQGRKPLRGGVCCLSAAATAAPLGIGCLMTKPLRSGFWRLSTAVPVLPPCHKGCAERTCDTGAVAAWCLLLRPCH
jgi:hypothetical protein